LQNVKQADVITVGKSLVDIVVAVIKDGYDLLIINVGNQGHKQSSESNMIPVDQVTLLLFNTIPPTNKVISSRLKVYEQAIK
jgi:hypothetical protein